MNAFFTDGELAAILLGRLHVRAGMSDFTRRSLPGDQRVAYMHGRCAEVMDRLFGRKR